MTPESDADSTVNRKINKKRKLKGGEKLENKDNNLDEILQNNNF